MVNVGPSFRSSLHRNLLDHVGENMTKVGQMASKIFMVVFSFFKVTHFPPGKTRLSCGAASSIQAAHLKISSTFIIYFNFLIIYLFVYLPNTIKSTILNIKTIEIKWNDKIYTCNECKAIVWCCLVIPGHEGIIPSTANLIPGHEGIVSSTANDKQNYSILICTRISPISQLQIC